MGLNAPVRRAVDDEHLLLLKGLMIAVVVALALLAAWRYGLLGLVWVRDPTGLTIAITLIFATATLHGAVHLVRLSRALNNLREVQAFVERSAALASDRWDGPVAGLRDGVVCAHLKRLWLKACRSGRRPIDQTLLLDSFEAELRRGHAFGWFVADFLLSLGLLGTVIGFILMLTPIGGLDAGDASAVKGALAAMSDGMAVALYTTLTGLIGGMLLKVLGLVLDHAVDDLVRDTTCLTEIYVLPAIERSAPHAPA